MHRGKFIKFPQELSFHRISPPSPVLWSVGIYIFEIAGKEALTYWHKFIDISVLVVDHTGNLAKQSRGRRREGTRRNLDAFQPPSPQRKPVDELNNIIVTVTLAAFETQFILACYSRSRQFGSPAPLHYSNRAFVVVGSSTRIPNNTSSYYTPHPWLRFEAPWSTHSSYLAKYKFIHEFVCRSSWKYDFLEIR